MKFYGDIPAEHLQTIKELQELEVWFNVYKESLPIISSAKGLVCMGCDYYSMEIEEEGERLFLEADKRCPGYFSNQIKDHIKTDEEFSILMDRLKSTLGYEFAKSLGYNE